MSESDRIDKQLQINNMWPHVLNGSYSEFLENYSLNDVLTCGCMPY